MIGYLKGKVLLKSEKSIVLDVNNVGYKVICNTNNLRNGEDVEFLIHTVVREDALELFGFKESESLALFEKLINISGIGPRSALQIVNMGTIESLTDAINKGDIGFLTGVSGIGKKTAEKIILELRGQLSDLNYSDSDTEVVAALKAMGYSEKEAQQAAKNASGETTQEKIKSALKQVKG